MRKLRAVNFCIKQIVLYLWSAYEYENERWISFLVGAISRWDGKKSDFNYATISINFKWNSLHTMHPEDMDYNVCVHLYQSTLAEFRCVVCKAIIRICIFFIFPLAFCKQVFRSTAMNFDGFIPKSIGRVHDAWLREIRIDVHIKSIERWKCLSTDWALSRIWDDHHYYDEGFVLSTCSNNVITHFNRAVFRVDGAEANTTPFYVYDKQTTNKPTRI